jgi:hypothetical protein
MRYEGHNYGVSGDISHHFAHIPSIDFSKHVEGVDLISKIRTADSRKLKFHGLARAHFGRWPGNQFLSFFVVSSQKFSSYFFNENCYVFCPNLVTACQKLCTALCYSKEGNGTVRGRWTNGPLTVNHSEYSQTNAPNYSFNWAAGGSNRIVDNEMARSLFPFISPISVVFFINFVRTHARTHTHTHTHTHPHTGEGDNKPTAES